MKVLYGKYCIVKNTGTGVLTNMSVLWKHDTWIICITNQFSQKHWNGDINEYIRFMQTWYLNYLYHKSI